MNIFGADKIMDRLDKMLDNAIAGKPVETDFDETRMSAIETKLARYLAMTGAGKAELAEEKARINELISDISHQTKTPVANIMLYAQLLEEADLPDNSRPCAEALAAQAEKLNFLIASLVKASRLESGIISLTPKLQLVQPMLDRILQQAAALAEGKGIAVVMTKTDSSAVFDSKWTAEALYNILDNAIKYTPAGGVISVSVTAYRFFCRIDISDTGIGISEEETAKIFLRFYRCASVDTEGVGIGLYLAREIIGGEGGYIKVKSEVGGGSVFSVFLPLKQPGTDSL